MAYNLYREVQEIPGPGLTSKAFALPVREDTIFCCVAIRTILTFGKTYKVEKWIEHEFGRDPAVVCDDGITRMMWKGLFHD